MRHRSGVEPTIVILISIMLALLAGSLLYMTVYESSTQTLNRTEQTYNDTERKIGDQIPSLIEKLREAITGVLSGDESPQDTNQADSSNS